MVALLIRSEWFLDLHKTTQFLGHSGLETICYVLIWALQLLIIQKGMETVRKFQDWAGPAVWIAMLVLAVGLVVKAGGLSFEHGIPMNLLLEKTKDAGITGAPGSFWALTAVGATWITYFAALYLNFCDFSRYAKNRQAVKVGNLWGLPVNLIAFSLVAGITTIAAFQVYGEVLLHPEQISAKFDSWFLALLAALTFAVATLGINVVANFVSAAFDISNVFPKRDQLQKGWLHRGRHRPRVVPVRALGRQRGEFRQRDRRDDGTAARHHPGRLLPHCTRQPQHRRAVPGAWRIPLRGRLEHQCAHRHRHRRGVLDPAAELHNVCCLRGGTPMAGSSAC